VHRRSSADIIDLVMATISPIIDVNITLGQWPMRRVACDRIDVLVEKLRAHDVRAAWAGHFDGLFHADLSAVNNRLVQLCRSQAGVSVVPFASINPAASNWEAELDRCVSVHHIRGVRLHPAYHDYTLDHPHFARFLAAAAERKVVVQLAVLMEDARMMHPLLRVPPVDIGPLDKLVSQTPGLRLVLLNALTGASRTDKLYRLTNAGDVYVEIAMLETLAGLENLVKDISLERILFGSHSPSFYFEAAILKLQEANLPVGHTRVILSENARRVLGTA
jgi:predicted TIM-barrel fold metal-dependent hydrolase